MNIHNPFFHPLILHSEKKEHTALLKYYIVWLAVCAFLFYYEMVYSSSSQFNFPFSSPTLSLSLSLTYCVVYKIQ